MVRILLDFVVVTHRWDHTHTFQPYTMTVRHTIPRLLLQIGLKQIHTLDKSMHGNLVHACHHRPQLFQMYYRIICKKVIHSNEGNSTTLMAFLVMKIWQTRTYATWYYLTGNQFTSTESYHIRELMIIFLIALSKTYFKYIWWYR